MAAAHRSRQAPSSSYAQWLSDMQLSPTKRRRKVRCDEQHPNCSHCKRLRLDCSWQQDTTPRSNNKKKVRTHRHIRDQPESGRNKEKVNITTSSPAPDTTPTPLQESADDSAFNKIFNYASFMWDDLSSNLSPNWDTVDMNTSEDLASWPEMSLPIPAPLGPPLSNSATSTGALVERRSKNNLESSTLSARFSIGWSESQLADYFAHSAAPPILATVETSARWLWMRKELTSMTSSSEMVKFGVIAFVALELESACALEPATYSRYYRTAKERLAENLEKINNDKSLLVSQLRPILAVLFLLSYIDLLTKDVSNVHANLRHGFNALQMVDIESLGVTGISPSKMYKTTFANPFFTEKRLVSWLRLLDARAAGVGGEGLFLNEDDNTINTDLRSPDSSIEEIDSALDDDAEAALEDFIMRPAFLFFQKVQLFMGRISKIDLWHRRRGTVEDETEVMLIAAEISRDIKALWQQRPPMMDHAVAGRLGPLLSPRLAETTTRMMRLAHANFFTSFIHLHRVAYKRSVSSLPVNMLWPLMMLGVETEDLDERVWVISCIKEMGNVASNAGITAEVLQEVIRRQDENQQRMDIREVMHETFNRAFAIV
ncbi:hypothetical protein N7510_004379 [Penicillium lagena]|uniref:uncharacterized protein n=1 Tax=Penicillium lagena TaxID=94218 RepID=UPI0025425BAD|nr:uncharacterized protein N7510_004379 [Penicillium lagena]KAJ5620395.1 hypothetical protein N7510_004379 [Penicillium lagena]